MGVLVDEPREEGRGGTRGTTCCTLLRVSTIPKPLPFRFAFEGSREAAAGGVVVFLSQVAGCIAEETYKPENCVDG